MNVDDYKLNMDLVVAALRAASTIALALTDEDLDELERTLQKADALGFVLVVPIDFPQAMDNIRYQREALAMVRKLRA